MKKQLFSFLILVLTFSKLNGQCYTLPSYCTPSFANVAGYSIGLQNVTIGNINNSSIATGNAPNYYDYTNLSTAGTANGTLSISIKNGSGNSTEARIYVDYNNDGQFSTSSPELVWTSTTTTAGATVTGSFTIPSGTPVGIYRMRVTGDLANQPINPCALNYGEVEDYTLVVTGSTDDAASIAHTSPSYFTTGNNTIGFSFINLSSSTLSSIDIGYKLDNNTPVTQSLTGLSVAPGALYTATFTTQLNISTTGTYNLKAWVNNANGAGTQSASNDSICRRVVVYCGSALSGTYTIDPAGTGSSNFTSIGAVDTSLRACGISGPVTFNIANGTYTYQLELSSVSGLSSSNTITFKGVGSSPSNCIITAATTALKPYIVRLNSVSYVTFKNMTLRSTGSSDAWVAHIMNGTNNLFNNCVIEMTGTGASSTNSTFVAAVVNGSLTTLSTTSSLNKDNTFDSCTFNAGYYGLYHSSSNGANTINVWNSKFNNQYYYGLYFNSSAMVKIRNNEINMRTSNNSSVAIYLINCNASGANYHEIKNNKILNAGQYGMQFLTSSGSGSANGQVYNNFIGGGFRNTTAIYGISNNSSRYQFYHNSINLDFNSSAAYGIYLSGGSLNDVRNNHLVITGNAIPTAVPFFSTASSSVSNLDYNNYFTNSGFNLVNIGTTLYTTANYRTAFPNGGGTSSINLNPYFISNTNLHTNNYCNNGVNLSVSTDIDGQTRSNPPDIGADELTSVPGDDIGVMKINTPGFPLNTGSQAINVTIKNYGNNTITSADINYTVNGGSAVTQAWSGSLSPCDTANVTFTTNYNFTNGVNKLMVYTSSPNSGTDSLSLNDTASFTLCPAMSGNYTIGSSGDFSNFSNAVSAMICGGLKGPVTFTVDAGTYNEQINIPAIRGSSAANSITFKSASGVASSVKLTYGSTVPAANYTLRIFTNSFVKIKDMSIIATGSTYGTALMLSGNTANDTFTNVIFEGYTATSNTTNHAVIALTSGSISNFITFNNCKVNNGSYGTYFQSNSSLPSSENLSILGCTFSNQYSYGMYHQYLNGLILKNNSITTNSTFTTYNGMYNYWIMIANDINRPIITGNKIAGAISGIGMYNQYIGVNSTITTPRRALVANNMIQIGRNASSTYGLRENNGNGVDYIHNSINIGNTQTTNATAAAFLEGNSYGSNVVLNNVFSNYGGGAALRINTVSFYPTCDYNNLYTSGANIAYLNTTAQATLANWQSASSRDAASISTNPVFTSNTNLHSNAAAMDNAGQASTLVTTDIDDQPRCPNGSCPGGTSNPDIGADEYIAVALDASVSTISNTNACSGVSTNVDVIIKNMGTDTLKSATIEWSVDGTAQTPFNWTGLLPQGQLSSSFAIGSFAFTSPSSVVKVWTTSPNAGSDGNTSNDTMQSSPSLLLSGTYTIGGSNPSFPSFTAAATYLNTNGICGPVIFNVRQGTYTERIQLNAITGSSSTNSITFRADPNNTADAEITINNNSAAADNHTIFLNGTSFIIFNGLKITNASPGNGTFGSVIRLAGAQDSVAFINNNITGPITTSTSQNFAVVNHSNGAANMCNRFMLNNNQVKNGSYGVYMVGNTVSTTFEAKARILNNDISGAYYTGIYSQFQNDIHIINNKVILSTTSQTGSRGIYTISNDQFRIEKNTVNNFGQFGIYLQSANNQNGTGTTRSTVNNNMVGGQSTGTSPYGIYFGSSTPTSRLIDIFHNSVSLNSTATGAALFFQNTNAYVSDLDIRNNSFANFNAQGTYVCYFYFSGTYPVANLVINYNNYFTNNTNNLMFAIGTTGYNTFNGGSPTYNANSRGGNPNYRNNLTDLHSKPTSTQLNDVGTNLSSVTTDIDNDARPISPSTIVDMGADEYNYVPSIGVISIITPTLPVSVGTQDVTLKVQNYSTTTVSSFQVKYKAGINGTVRSFSWTGSLGANSSVNHTFTGANAYTYNGNYDTLYAWTDNPNGLPDAYNPDDTSILYICRALNGTYTLNPGLPSSATNFSSFEELFKTLSNCGILGNVIVNVTSGVYNGQYNLFSIPGASATRTVTIQAASGNPADVVMSYNANIAANFTLRLTNTSYLTLKNMSINAINTNYGTALLFNNSTSNTFKNVIFNGINTTSTSTNLAVIASPLGISSFNFFDSCTVNYGSMGTYFNSNSVAPSTENLRFNRCNFNNQYAYGMYNQYQIGLTLTNNNIVTNTPYTGYTGMYNYWVLIPNDINRPVIVGNKIIGGQGGNGMYNYYFGVNSTITAARRSLVANNMVQIGGGTNNAVGIRDGNGNGVDYIHNTANITSNLTSNGVVAGLFEGTAYGNNVILNNIFSNEGGGAAIRINNLTYYPSCDNNDLYTTGTTLGYYNTTALNTLADWRAGTARDLNSLSVNPMFNSSSDLHISQAELDNRAIIFSSVVSDIDGDGRCPLSGTCAFGISKPDVGADEFDRTPPKVHAEFGVLTPTVCDGEGHFFQNSSTVEYGTLQYVWDFGDSSSNSPAPDPTHVFPGPGTYLVKLTIKSSLYGAMDDTSMLVTVVENPVAAFKNTNQCEGTALTFQNNSSVGSGTLTYVWDFGDGQNSTATNPTHNYNSAGSYKVTLTTSTSNTGCKASFSKTVYQFPRPDAKFDLPVGGACNNVDFTAINNSTLSYGIQGAYWTFGDNGYSTKFNGTHTYTNPGTYTVKLLAVSEFDCRDSAEKQIVVKETPSPTFTVNQYCLNTPSIFTNTSTDVFPNPIYTWTFSDNSSYAQKNITKNWSKDGRYTVTLKTSYSNGCSASTSRTFEVLPQPKAKFEVNDICSGQEAVFLNQTYDTKSDIQYYWDYGIGNSTKQNPVVKFEPTQSTTYTVMLVAKYPSACSDTTYRGFTVHENPTCDFTFKNLGNRQYSFTPANTTYTSYFWQFGNGQTSSTAQPTHIFPKLNKYDVTLAATNDKGCKCSKTVTIMPNTSIDDQQYFPLLQIMPNPNNGLFTVSNSDNEAMHIEVYDLAGKVIYSTDSSQHETQIDLQDAAEGVYFVKVTINGLSQTSKIVVSE